MQASFSSEPSTATQVEFWLIRPSLGGPGKSRFFWHMMIECSSAISKDEILNEAEKRIAVSQSALREDLTREYLAKQKIESSGSSVADMLYVMTAECRISLEGNLVPKTWYKKIKGVDGTPYHLAIAVLSEIVFRYRSQLKVDDSSKQHYLKKHFERDLYHLNRKELAETFCVKPQAISRALAYLEKDAGLMARLGGFAPIARVHEKTQGSDYFSQRIFVKLDFDGLEALCAQDKAYTKNDGYLRRRPSEDKWSPSKEALVSLEGRPALLPRTSVNSSEGPSTRIRQEFPTTTKSGFAAGVVGVGDLPAGAAAPCTPASGADAPENPVSFVTESEPQKAQLRELFIQGTEDSLAELDSFYTETSSDELTDEENNIAKAFNLYDYISDYYKSMHKSKAPWTASGRTRLLRFVEDHVSFSEFSLFRVIAHAWIEFYNAADGERRSG